MIPKAIYAIIVVFALCACGASADNPEADSATRQTAQFGTVSGNRAENMATEPGENHEEIQQPEPEGYKVTFLEIGAESCIPCRMMQPIMKEIAEEYPGVVEVIFHDLNKDRSIGHKYSIRVMPTQVFLDANGREFFRHEGFYPKGELTAMLNKYLAGLE